RRRQGTNGGDEGRARSKRERARRHVVVGTIALDGRESIHGGGREGRLTRSVELARVTTVAGLIGPRLHATRAAIDGDAHVGTQPEIAAGEIRGHEESRAPAHATN